MLVALLLIPSALANVNHTATVAKHYKFYDDPSVNLTINSVNQQDPDCSHSQQWFCFNSTTKTYNCLHGNNIHLKCSENGPLLKLGYCITYSEDTGLVTIAKCPYYFQTKGYNVTMITGDGYYIHLPKTLAELNDSMCRPMNRKGIVCSECIDGFGPSVNSIGYRCANCTDDPWYKVPLFLVLLFAPITIFYLFILTFQISMMSPPTPCFIMYAQVIIMSWYFVDRSKLQSVQAIFDDSGHLRLDAKIMFTLYGIFNLDFFCYDLLPPFCISSRLKPIHIAFFGYISVLYPVLLIFLTWLCVKLHGYNFRPIVCLWRPFHRCFVKLRRGWDNTNDIIDVFTTFFLLSYLKFLYQFQLLLTTQLLRNYNSTVGSAIKVSTSSRMIMDLHVTADSSEYIPYAVIGGSTIVLFFIVPTLLLMKL